MTTQLSLLTLSDRLPSEEQLRAAHAGPDGAYLVAAGPGTGKTFTMVERFTWLVRDCGVPLDSILVVTFTEKAAEELRERIAAELSLLDRKSAVAIDTAWIGTFHSVCHRLLEEDAYLVGVAREVKVLDEVGQRLLLEQLTARLRSGAEPGVDLEQLQALQPDEVAELLRHGLQFVLKLKGRGISPRQFRERALELHERHDHTRASPQAAAAELEAIELLARIYETYESLLRDSQQIDFDDLIVLTIRALRESEAFRTRCRCRFRYLLVDEFQDSNHIQLELVRLLAAENFGNVSVVGDAKQSIYGWRDADIENIRSNFPGERLPLTRNRRSVQQILDLATSFIARDGDFAEEDALVAERGAAPGAPVTILMASSPEREAALVAGQVRRLVAEGYRYSDIAILSRSLRYLPPEFELRLQQEGIPYVTSAGGGFFDREEVKDVVALLRLTENPMDDAALVRVLQGPLVRVTDAGMYELARRRRGLRGMRLRDCLDASLGDGHPEMPADVATRATGVIAATDRLAASRDALTVADVLNQLLVETGYLRHCELRSRREGPRAILNVRKVFRMANRFERDFALGGIGDFVRHLDDMMESDVTVAEAQQDSEIASAHERPDDAVSLLTIHKAKGLEFRAVFVVNVRPPNPRDTERLFFEPDAFGFVMKWWRGDKHPCYSATLPATNALTLARQEQRRLVYVALTRARDRLFISASRQEELPAEVVAEEGDHFAEILSWAVGNPEAATIVAAEQLELPEVAEHAEVVRARHDQVDAILDRFEKLKRAEQSRTTAAAAPRVKLSFSQLQLYEVCPVRYRFSEVWQVPAAPDELLPEAARSGHGELGAGVHAALAAWHSGDASVDLRETFALLAQDRGLDAEATALGAAMMARYLEHPLSRARTLGVEVEFNLLIDNVRVKGIVDRVCEYEGRSVLVDYKTNSRLDESLVAAYRTQLQLYGVAAREGLLPGGDDPRLLLFDVRRGAVIEVAPDPDQVLERISAAAAAIRSGDFALRPQHDGRPCFACAYRPICPSRRA